MHECGFLAHEGLHPVLWTDFNFVDRPITAQRGDWILPSGQRVILDDGGGTRCAGNVIGRPTWDRQNKYVLVEIDNDSFEDYTPMPGEVWQRRDCSRVRIIGWSKAEPGWVKVREVGGDRHRSSYPLAAFGNGSFSRDARGSAPEQRLSAGSPSRLRADPPPG